MFSARNPLLVVWCISGTSGGTKLLRFFFSQSLFLYVVGPAGACRAALAAASENARCCGPAATCP